MTATTPAPLIANASNDVVSHNNNSQGEESLASDDLTKMSLKDGTDEMIDSAAIAITAEDTSDENRDDYDVSIAEKKVIDTNDSDADASTTEKKEDDTDDNGDDPPLAPPPNNKMLRRSSSSSFIRAHDLGEVPKGLQQGGSNVSSSRLHESMKAQGGFRGPDKTATEGLFFLDQDLKLILDSLTQLGFAEATDESARFTPGRETANVLKKRAMEPSSRPAVDADWPIRPWYAASLGNINEILIWNGMVHSHTGFGHDWPIVKARGIIPTSPRNMAEFLWNSDKVQLYNSMSQGREDGTVFQEGLDTRAEDSPFGIPGCAKILKSYNKFKLVPRMIEIISILHARPVGPPGTYLLVSRSLWESDDMSGEAASNFVPPSKVTDTIAAQAATSRFSRSTENKIVRTEMFLAVQLLRPLNGGKHCEMTTIAHALAPGINKTVAKTAANVSAVKIIRDVQALFMK